jgi:myb proto-oncogene protein
MGIDPVTHETLHKEAVSEETSKSGNNCLPENDHSVNHSEENSSSQTENCSSTDDHDSLLLENICNNESLMNSLWNMDEAPLVNASNWENLSNGENIDHMPSLEENYAWLLDCQDFGIHDFGYDCFSDVELNVLNTLEMGEKH